MAAEFSRELGEKVFRGKSQIVQLGFWVGGSPGYGFRRVMLSATGKTKGLMQPGEQKSFTMDRVTLIPGPPEEVAVVRLLFSLAASGNGPTAIARELNRRGITHNGRPWIHQTVHAILHNPKYMGCNTWNKCTQRLHGPVKHLGPQFWVTKPKAFKALVSKELFQRAQDNIPRPRVWADEEILRKIRRLLRTKGRLSEKLLLNARNMPCPNTLHKHFGTYRQIYERIGYKLDRQADFMSMQNLRSTRLRNSIISELTESFSEHIALRRRPRAGRVALLIDDAFVVAILFARPKQRRGAPQYWEVETKSYERDYISLVCLLNQQHDGVLGYYVFPTVRMWKSHRLRNNDPALRSAIKLSTLSEFYAAAKKLWAEGSDSNPQNASA